MKRFYVRCSSSIYFAILIMVVSAGCSAMITTEATPTLVPTSTPEKLRLSNGEINTCLLISPSEVESVLGIKVVSETRFAVVGSIRCIYTSVSDNVVIFQTAATTDITLKKVDSHFSAVKAYEMQKRSDLNMIKIMIIKDIENFGDQAYSEEDSSSLNINVLNNNIYYQFHTRVDGGIGYEALMKLAEIALQKMP